MMGLGDRQAKVVGRDTQLIHRCPRTHSSYTGVQGHTARHRCPRTHSSYTGVQGHSLSLLFGYVRGDMGHYSHAVTCGQYYVMHCTVTHMQSDSLGYTLFTVCVSSSCSPSLSNGRQYNAMLVCVEGLHLQRRQLFSGRSHSCTADTLSSDIRTCTHAHMHERTHAHTYPPTPDRLVQAGQA